MHNVDGLKEGRAGKGWLSFQDPGNWEKGGKLTFRRGVGNGVFLHQKIKSMQAFLFLAFFCVPGK